MALALLHVHVAAGSVAGEVADIEIAELRHPKARAECEADQRQGAGRVVAVRLAGIEHRAELVALHNLIGALHRRAEPLEGIVDRLAKRAH